MQLMQLIWGLYCIFEFLFLSIVIISTNNWYFLNLCRFKLEFEAEYQGTSAKFVFWDRECNQLLGKTAAELHAEMTAVLLRCLHI
jgi:hypothetical protein